MIVDGISIARSIESEVSTALRRRTTPLRLVVFTCEPNLATQKFLALKRTCAERVGVELVVRECAAHESRAFASSIQETRDADGIIIQLPFPPDINLEEVLGVLPAVYDVDAIGKEATELLRVGAPYVLPPVVAAISEISSRYNLTFEGKSIVIVGRGRLVGAPASLWSAQQGGIVTTVTKESEDLMKHTKDADVLILGAGVPGLIRPHMVKEGVAIFDAGSSEDAGKLVGDADSTCAEKSALFTPVPGGIGPITVALIFKNLLTLATRR